jgi:cation diffusion facilitator CzcD-associated flavoprotein CzcO
MINNPAISIGRLTTQLRRAMSTATLQTLECDYLVVGAGAASLAFIDTLLTELPNTKVILIDKKEQPSGHWQDAYGFVRLHQPSLVYGIASKQLEGNWLKLIATKFTLPWEHRATKQELLKYFGNFVQEKILPSN